MIKVLLSVLTALLAISGLCELIYTIRLFFLTPHVKTKGYIVVYLRQNFALEQLRYIFEKQKWNGEGYAACIVAITDELSEAEGTLCKEFSKNKSIFLSKFKDIEITLEEICS